ncbi:BREX-3 system phosphatase PglZ [Marinobacter sp. S6332]|uniref:BREX-3 system phosphatase PglZ n=1 Tax=Marinobacter sp. S6332 TaxID=2926403 RepID=UPI001FF50A71|nr:BREX-3 system phosphatase PglZ [Marinobacter sp. S6332]MCK0165798.1 BREX-3 system phosphatase PglZ [Marinobacter sp. S6332]
MTSDLYESWRKPILRALEPGLSDFFVVEDTDGLLAEPGIQKMLQARDVQFYAYDDPIAFRHFYETRIRGDEVGRERTLVISLGEDAPEARSLPFDVINRARVESINISDCFPDLFSPIVRQLQALELDLLYRAVDEFMPGKLGDLATRDFVLRHVFQVAPEVIQTGSDLLRVLLRLAYRDIALPDLLKARLAKLLRKRAEFKDWPLELVIVNRQLFFEFLQHNWRPYVYAVSENVRKGGSKEPLETGFSGRKVRVNVVLPFGHDDVKVYIDNLFLEGHLQPIEIDFDQKPLLRDHWCRMGVKLDPEADVKQKASGLIGLCSESLPEADARYQNWFVFSARWAELTAIYHTQPNLIDWSLFLDLQKQVDIRFKDWMVSSYGSLHTQPPVPPAMLHHLPKLMARDISRNQTSKVALILVDGLSMDQWATLRNHMHLGDVVDESFMFAWVPTVTSISRQALFSAKAPHQFPKTLSTTSKEGRAWRNFWVEQGLSETQIHYEVTVDATSIKALKERTEDPRMRVLGLVINTVDDMMHGMQLGAAGMHNQIKLWAQQGVLGDLINELLRKGYRVHLTSDHGNVAAVGGGKVSEGSVARSRGERMRLYSSDTLRQQVFESVKERAGIYCWPQVGLPKDAWPLVMTGREAFVAKGDTIVGHGGICIEEVIVPHITYARENS